MNRIRKKFEELKFCERKGFIPFVTAGDPTLDASLAIIRSIANAGADIIELGVPFTDPMADGPTIQRSSQRALRNGTTLADVLRLAAEFRQASDVPVVLFSYLNPLLAYGLEKLAKDARAAGVDGILITDAVDREAENFRPIFDDQHIDLISLIAPTTSEHRLERICRVATGFIYAVSRAGVTGPQTEISRTAETLVARARRYTDLPIAVGFGISTSQQVLEVWRYADAAVVGSAIVQTIESEADDEMLAEHARKYVLSLMPRLQKHPSEPKVEVLIDTEVPPLC